MPPKKKTKSTNSKTMFFSSVFGFKETDYEPTRQKLLDLAQFQSSPASNYPREKCTFTIHGETISAGIFSMPSVEELEREVQQKLCEIKTKKYRCKITVKNEVGEARELHKTQPGSVIQAASQFNLLESPGPSITPEVGISGYIHDATQGPACAMACAAGTAYRNYLVPVPFQDIDVVPNDNRGQRRGKQLDGLKDLETYLMENYGDTLKIPPWKATNGYVDSTSTRIQPFNNLLAQEGALQKKLESLLRVGVQEETTVTHVPSWAVTCTQVYSSAISVGYSYLPTSRWEPLARLVLNATYKATLLVGVLKAIEAETRGETAKPILLSKVGAGVFQNKDEWIIDAISKAITTVSQYDVNLDIRIVHFRSIDHEYRQLDYESTKGNTKNEL